MYVKFIDENTVEKAPKVLKDELNTYSNPLPETLAKFGYFPLIETECPNEEGYTYTFHYATDNDTSVLKIWEAHEIENEEEPIEE